MIAFAAVVALGVTVVVFSGIYASQARAHARERTLLISQLLHATGNTWQEPPAAAARRQPATAGDSDLRFPPDQLP